MYKGKVGLPSKANTPQIKKYNKKLSYIDKIKTWTLEGALNN